MFIIHPGQIVEVKPDGEDDPIAMRCQGQRFRVRRIRETQAGTRMVYVESLEEMPLYAVFRECDLSAIEPT